MNTSESIIQSRHKLGSNIKYARKELKLSQEQLASIVGCERSFISRIEHGKCGIPFDTVLLIADGLGVSTSALLAGIDDPPKRDGPLPINFSFPR